MKIYLDLSDRNSPCSGWNDLWPIMTSIALTYPARSNRIVFTDSFEKNIPHVDFHQSHLWYVHCFRVGGWSYCGTQWPEHHSLPGILPVLKLKKKIYVLGNPLVSRQLSKTGHLPFSVWNDFPTEKSTSVSRWRRKRGWVGGIVTSLRLDPSGTWVEAS